MAQTFIVLKVNIDSEGKCMIKETIFLAILIGLGGPVSEIGCTPDIVITITPTKETMIASGFSEDDIYFELKEYETTDNITLSSFKELNLNKSSKVKGRIVGKENGKYVFSVAETIFDLSEIGKQINAFNE